MQLSVEAVGAAAVANSTKKPQTERRKPVKKRWRLNDSELMQQKENQAKKNSTSASMTLGMTQREGRGRAS